MTLTFTNNATSVLDSSITDTDTTVVVTTGDGALFPSLGTGDYFYATLVSSVGDLEIVKVTARSSDTMTVTRAQEGTVAQAFAAGSAFENRPTAATFSDILDVVATVDSFPTPEDGKFVGDYDGSSALYPAFTAAEMRTALGSTTLGDGIFTIADEASFKSLVNLEPGTDIETYVTKNSAWNLNKASEAQAEAGTVDTVLMTPLRTAQAIDALTTSASLISVNRYGSSATYTVPANTSKVLVRVQGAGGGGGGTTSDAAHSAGGGGAGGYCEALITTLSPGNTVAVTVGSGGAGGLATGTLGTTGGVGSAGGQSKFGSYVTCTGGGGGGRGSLNGIPAGGTRGTVSVSGATYTQINTNTAGEMSYLSEEYRGGNGGDTTMGSGGRATGTSGASAPGLGGGGSGAGGQWLQGGTGGNGIVVVFNYA